MKTISVLDKLIVIKGNCAITTRPEENQPILFIDNNGKQYLGHYWHDEDAEDESMVNQYIVMSSEDDSSPHMIHNVVAWIYEPVIV